MKVLHILQPTQWLTYLYFIAIVVTVVGHYASALEQQQQLQQAHSQPQPQPQPQPQTRAPRQRQRQQEQDQPTRSPQKQFQNAEVNRTASDSLRFGTKIVDYPVAKLVSSSADNSTTKQKLPENTRQQQQAVPSSNDGVTNAAASRVPRRYDAPAVPAMQQVGQFDESVAKKNRRNNSTAAVMVVPTVKSAKPKQREGKSSSRTNSRDGKSVATAAGQRSSSFDSQAQSARQPTVSRNAAQNSSSKRSRVESQSPSTSATGGASSRREVKKSRKDLNATNGAVRGTKSFTSTTTATPTTTSARPPVIPNIALSNPFSFFSPSLWGLSSPPKTSSTKKPPKKYTPPTTVATMTTTTTTTTIAPTPTKLKKKIKPTTLAPILPKEIPTTTLAPVKKSTTTTDGPFRIALPTFNFFGAQSQRTQDNVSEKDKRDIVQNLRIQFECPRESEVRFQLFPKICKADEDCTVWNRNELCCEIFGAKSCVSGIAKPLEETSHTPILGLIPRKCPTRPLAELWWQVQECETDMDCWPRVCCPDGNKRYCRTSQPELETVPVPVKRSFNYLSEYLECTPPPPPIFDLHPKTCASTLDCFPNVCCQEAGLRHCRPPKKSLLTWMANFLNVDFVKRLAQNIVIK